MNRRPSRGAVLGLLLCLGCASAELRSDYDPLEQVNRKIFWFNLKAQKYALDPIAKVWHVLPDPAERSVARFFRNLAFPIDFINNALQGKPERAGTATGRFLVNSTVGLGGLFDPAQAWGLEPVPEDFGQTLGLWGLAPGPYLMLPLWGPANVRESCGYVGDYFGSLQPFLLPGAVSNALYGTLVVNERALDLEASEKRRAAAIDYYVFVRDAYYQLRLSQIHDGRDVEPAQAEDLYDVDYE
jgi:phospholipid-binding lipoprotein MlaA